MIDMVPRIRCALSIAGSDSGGGAGIQADLKAFAACGVHGTTAVTAITAQNTVGVDAIEPVSPRMIVAQIHAIAHDVTVDAVKIGMLGTVEAIQAVARGLDVFAAAPPPIVIDPVMVSESGAALLHDDARAMLVSELLPRATVLTPNLPEARALVGMDRDAFEVVVRPPRDPRRLRSPRISGGGRGPGPGHPRARSPVRRGHRRSP